MFGITADAIRGRAFREHWNELKRVKQDKTAVSQALPEVRLPASPGEIVERAEKLRGPASFRRGGSPSRPSASSTSSRRRILSRSGNWTVSPRVLVKTEKVGRPGLRYRLRRAPADHHHFVQRPGPGQHLDIAAGTAGVGETRADLQKRRGTHRWPTHWGGRAFPVPLR